jgi:hypothetical protein
LRQSRATKFKLAINLQTVWALDLSISTALLATGDGNEQMETAPNGSAVQRRSVPDLSHRGTQQVESAPEVC